VNKALGHPAPQSQEELPALGPRPAMLERGLEDLITAVRTLDMDAVHREVVATTRAAS